MDNENVISDQVGNVKETVAEWLGIVPESWIVTGVMILGLIVLSILVNWIAKKVLLRIVLKAVKKTRNKWDDIFLEKKVFERLSHLAPALVIYLSASTVFPPTDEVSAIDWLGFTKRMAAIYIILALTWFVHAFLNAITAVYQTLEMSKRSPIKGYVQAVKIIVTLIALILVIANLINQSPLLLLSGLGALTAVLLLVFKDTILGFVASIQLSTNRMVLPGDWISVPKAGADGDVIDVSLTTVKVQNWDKTITSVPIYSLISDSFTNWRGMSESGGRRIKRSIKIEMSSIRFCDEALVDRFQNIALIREYVTSRRAAIAEHRKEQGLDPSDNINGPQLTNVGTFRHYVAAYLRANPNIHQDMTFLVRQLARTPEGLPLEIYVFSRDQRWAYYEGIQGDIFDHLLAVAPEFDLRIFQYPSGHDLRILGQGLLPGQ